MGPMSGPGLSGGGGALGPLGPGRSLGGSYSYAGSGGYRGNEYALEAMHGGINSGSSSASLNGPINAFPSDHGRPYILSSTLDEDDPKPNLEPSYGYFPRAIYESVLPPPIKSEAQGYEIGRIKDEGLFGPGNLFTQSSRGVYNMDTVY